MLPKEYLDNLFKNEEASERLSLILEHRNFTINVLGENPKLFLNDWIKTKTFKEYPMKRKFPIIYEHDEQKEILHSESEFNPENISHDKMKVFSVIDVNLWDQAKWKGFGFFVDSLGLGIFMAFENIEAGKEIFDNWIRRFSSEDKDELINITIVKGVDKNNPFWYRVLISSNIDKGPFKSNSLFVTARYHEMNTNCSQNLDNLISSYNVLKQFRLCPAEIIDDGKDIKPYLNKAILKRTLFVRNAWEIGDNDLESIVIRKGDSPLIPNDVVDAPILKVLKRKAEQKNR